MGALGAIDRLTRIWKIKDYTFVVRWLVPALL
jgi:hypothetical protein